MPKLGNRNPFVIRLVPVLHLAKHIKILAHPFEYMIHNYRFPYHFIFLQIYLSNSILYNFNKLFGEYSCIQEKTKSGKNKRCTNISASSSSYLHIYSPQGSDALRILVI